MSMSLPVEAVVNYLEEKGYALWPRPILVRGVQFSFDAVLQAPDRFSDVVLVCDILAHDHKEDFVRQIMGLARAFDMAGKANPLTTIIVGGRLESEFVNRLMGVTRLLALGGFEPSEATQGLLENGLAILTPLNIDAGGGNLADPVVSLRAAATGLRQEVLDLIDVAEASEGAVREALSRLIERDLEPAWEEYE